MFQHLIRAACDQCEKSVTLNVRGEVQAYALLLKRRWVSIEGFYGTVAIFCCEPCKKAWIEKTEYVESEA